MPTWTVSNLNNEASLKAEPGTGAPLGHSWPVRTRAMGPHSLSRTHFPGRPWWLHGEVAPVLHTLCSSRFEQAEPGVSLAGVCPVRGRCRYWQWMCLAKVTSLLTRQDFSLPAPHFQVAKYSASISSARIYAEGTDCCQNKTLNHQYKTLFYEE